MIKFVILAIYLGGIIGFAGIGIRNGISERKKNIRGLSTILGKLLLWPVWFIQIVVETFVKEMRKA